MTKATSLLWSQQRIAPRPKPTLRFTKMERSSSQTLLGGLRFETAMAVV
jgi:hypothetical protein